jgi:hypothetical protein
VFKDTARIQLFRGSATGAVPAFPCRSEPLGIHALRRHFWAWAIRNASWWTVGAVYLFISDMAGSGTVVSIGSLPALPSDIALAVADADGNPDLLAAFFAATSTVAVHRFTVSPAPL